MNKLRLQLIMQSCKSLRATVWAVRNHQMMEPDEGPHFHTGNFSLPVKSAGWRRTAGASRAERHGTNFLLCNSIQDSSQFRYSTCIVVVLVHSLILCCGIGMPLPEESITVEATHTYKQRGSGCKQPHSLHHSKKLKHPLPCYSLLAGSDRNHRRLKDADGLFHYRSQLRHWQWTNTSEAM